MFLEKTENEKTHRAERLMKTESEHGVLLPQAKECHGLLAATKSQELGLEWALSQSLQKEPTLQTP